MTVRKVAMPSENICVIYARYSSHAQRDVSIDQQINACRAYAEKLGLTVGAIYADRALTGTSDKRPEFQRMVSDAPMGLFSHVVVYTLDRFARDRYDSAIYKRHLKEHGVRVLSASENISDDPTGVLLEALLEGMAEFYSKELAQKVRRGMYDNANRCMVNGVPPYGYKRGEDGKFAIDEAEAVVVREIFTRVIQGEAMTSIHDDLNARGFKTRTGGKWNRNSFGRMLSNERYTGVYIYDDIRIEGGMPAIIDKEQFNIMQHKLRSKANPRKNPQKRRRKNSIYYLTGKLYCGKCKAAMIGLSGKSNAPEPYYYYACQTRKKTKTCDKAMVSRDATERAIAAALKEYVLKDEVIEWVADCCMEHLKKEQESSELASLKNQLNDVQKAIKNLFSAMEQGIVSKHMQERIGELETEESDLTAKISLAQKMALTSLEREHIVAFLHTFKDGDINDKAFQALLFDTFLVRCYLYDDHMRIVFSYTGNDKTIDLPFYIDNVESDCEAMVRITPTMAHQRNAIRTPAIYHIGGLFVLICDI